ncbi:MAG: hypothetical protein Q4G58_16040, partial [bacterium]|nr:hypothetical protein [bacterium]
MLHNEYLRQEIQGNIDYVFNDLRAYLLKNVELPLYDPDKCLGDVDDIKHYLVHDILNIISYVYAYSSDEEKYDIVERCQMVFDLCKFYINFDLVSVIEYNSIINGVTQDNFEKKARVLVNELKIVNVLAEWKMMDGDVSQFYAYELLRGLSYYIVVGASNRKPIEECTKKDKALFIIFDKLFRRYCRLRHTFNSKCVGSLLETSYVFMKYYEGLFAFSGASLPMISGITEGNTYIDRCIFKYTKEFGDIKE